jgi:hypothetical protein
MKIVCLLQGVCGVYLVIRGWTQGWSGAFCKSTFILLNKRLVARFLAETIKLLIKEQHSFIQQKHTTNNPFTTRLLTGHRSTKII